MKTFIRQKGRNGQNAMRAPMNIAFHASRTAAVCWRDGLFIA